LKPQQKEALQALFPATSEEKKRPLKIRKLLGLREKTLFPQQ
jgi:hypothetical protein